MIQVCAQCSTRWDVRERQRVWCPRCRGKLRAPMADAPVAGTQWSPAAGMAQPAAPAASRPAQRLPLGYRWIAVRPGAPRPARRWRGPLGPTPRYAAIPRWGLTDWIDPAVARSTAPTRTGPSATTVRITLFGTLAVLGGAALVYFARYVLLVINRNTLLNSTVALAAVWLGLLAGVVALVAVITCVVVLTRWLLARRAAAFTQHGQPDPRRAWALRAGCLVPLVNLAWAPVYVVELAALEGHYARLRKPIGVWWVGWILSTAVSIFAIATSRVTDAQGIANNTVATMVGYLLAAATVAAVARVFDGFERRPVQRPAHRWLVVGDDGPAARVELAGQDPAA